MHNGRRLLEEGTNLRWRLLKNARGLLEERGWLWWFQRRFRCCRKSCGWGRAILQDLGKRHRGDKLPHISWNQHLQKKITFVKDIFYLAWKSLYDEMELFLLSSAVAGHSPFPHIRKATMTKSLRIWNCQFFPLQDLLKKILLNLVKMATTCLQWSSASPLTCSCRHCNL